MPWRRPRVPLRRLAVAVGIASLGTVAFVAPPRGTAAPGPPVLRKATEVKDIDMKTSPKFASESNSTTAGSAEDEVTTDFWSLTESDRSLTKGKFLDRSVAVLVLGLVTVLWGSQHAIIKYTLASGANDSLQAASLNLVRFTLAALCFCPFLPSPGSLLDQSRAGGMGEVRARLEWRAGAELGFWLFLGFCLQALGLLYTTAQRSGLLLYLNVKLVPFFAFSIFGRKVPLSAWLSAVAAFLGTTLVALDDQAGVPPNVGDLLSLMAAAASAMFILRLETFACATDPKAVNAVSTLSVALLCLPWALLVAGSSLGSDVLNGPVDVLAESALANTVQRCFELLKEQPLSVVYLGVLTTAFTNWLQTIGQQSIPATTASAIYALDPLWGAFFAYLFLGETLGAQGLLGCFILFAVWLYQLASTRLSEAETQPSP